MFARRVLSLLFVWASFSPVAAFAQLDGQEDLDKALDAKINAQTLPELTEVINLAQSALDKGLEEGDADFAKNLLASTLQQRAEAVSEHLSEGMQTRLGDPEFRQEYAQLRRAATYDLERALRHVDDSAGTHLLLGKLHSMPGGDQDRARKALDEAVRLSADDGPVLSQSLVARGRLQEDPQDRLKDFDAAVAADDHSAEALQVRGMARLALGQTEEGVADLGAAVELDPENVESLQTYAVAMAALRRFEEALQSMDVAIELSPESPSLLGQRARIHLEMGSTAAAIADFTKSLELFPENPALLLLRAGAHQQAEDFDAALADVEHALQLQPQYVPALRARALLRAGEGNFEEAIDDLNAALEITPEDPELLVRRGIYYNLTKNVRKAIDSFNAALKIAPEFAAAYQSRADALLNVGRQAEALKDYEQANKFSPDNTGVLNNMAWLMATSPDEQLRDGQRAIELATKACELTEFQQSHILSTLAAGYAESGDFDTAIEWSSKAVELAEETDDPAIKEQLAQELASYREKKPWRELEPGVNVAEAAEEPAGDLPRREDVEAAE